MAADWLHTAPLLTAAGWSHGWTGPGGPDFKTPTESTDHEQAVARLTGAVGLDGAAWATQVHGPRVTRVDGPGWRGEADALWTDVPGLGVVGRSADCPLILVGGRHRHGRVVTGFAHASWRSTVQHITRHLVQALCDAGAGPESLTAVICPSAGPCCYEVGPEVRDRARTALGPEADAWFVPRTDRFIFDLWAANTWQLREAGLNAGAIAQPAVCTICHTPRWPSYRRQGDQAGRFAAIIGA